jgi:uncharacterized membrane protein
MAKQLTAKRRTENEIEFGRIVAFSDGVFAIAITLLVLNLEVAKGLTEGQIDNALWEQREFFLAYAISFAVIGRFWLVHHRFFSEVEAFDGRLIGLNLRHLPALDPVRLLRAGDRALPLAGAVSRPLAAAGAPGLSGGG